MKHFKKILLATTLLGATSGAANAEFIPTDYLVQGDSRATLDTTTGKEWLDLSSTDGKSIDYVLEQMKEGGGPWMVGAYLASRKFES